MCCAKDETKHSSQGSVLLRRMNAVHTMRVCLYQRCVPQVLEWILHGAVIFAIILSYQSSLAPSPIF